MTDPDKDAGKTTSESGDDKTVRAEGSVTPEVETPAADKPKTKAKAEPKTSAAKTSTAKKSSARVPKKSSDETDAAPAKTKRAKKTSEEKPPVEKTPAAKSPVAKTPAAKSKSATKTKTQDKSDEPKKTKKKQTKSELPFEVAGDETNDRRAMARRRYGDGPIRTTALKQETAGNNNVSTKEDEETFEIDEPVVVDETVTETEIETAPEETISIDSSEIAPVVDDVTVVAEPEDEQVTELELEPQVEVEAEQVTEPEVAQVAEAEPEIQEPLAATETAETEDQLDNDQTETSFAPEAEAETELPSSSEPEPSPVVEPSLAKPPSSPSERTFEEIKDDPEGPDISNSQANRLLIYAGILVGSTFLLVVAIVIGAKMAEKDENNPTVNNTPATEITVPISTIPTAPTTQVQTTSTSTPVSTTNPVTPTTATPPPSSGTAIQLSGTGTRQSALFDLPKGPATVYYQTTGGSLSVHLLAQQSTGEGDTFTCNGACNENNIVIKEAGRYYLFVEGKDGTWNVRVER